MRLTTLMELLEAEIGVSTSARAKLDALVAERAPKKTRASATDSRKDASLRDRNARTSG
jgi:hypothetical protein